MKKIALSLISITTLLTAQKAFCWGDMGHETVAAIAEKYLTEDARTYVREILGIEPLPVAATWPDHVRDTDLFSHKPSKESEQAYYADDNDFSPYHFCEIPAGETYNPNKTPKDCYAAVTHSQDILKNTKSTREEKIIALRYLIHVVGDVHQPLHIGNGYDIGGNVCYVNWKENKDAKPRDYNFHSFWDDVLVEFAQHTLAVARNQTNPRTGKLVEIKYYPDFVTELLKLHTELLTDSAKQEIGTSSILVWLSESQAIREDGLYPDEIAGIDMSHIPAAEKYKHRAYCGYFNNQTLDKDLAVQPDSKKAPTLTPENYGKKYEMIVETQLIKGGLRLANLINQLAEANKVHAPKPTEEDFEQQTIKSIQDALRNKTN